MAGIFFESNQLNLSILMENKIEVERVNNTYAFEALREEWGILLSQSSIDDIFLTWEWLYAWWRAFGDKSDLWMLTVRENGALIGIAPLMLSTYNKLFLKLRILQNIGTPQNDVSGFIATKKELVIEAIYEYLISHKNEWDIFEMNALPENTCEAGKLPKLFQEVVGFGGYRTIKKTNEHFYLPINTNWDNYFNSLSKNLKRNLKRRLRRAEELGPVVHKRYRGVDLHWEQFLTIFQINKKGNFPSLYKTEKNKSFHRFLHEFMNDNRWIQIEVLYIKNEPVAFQYGFIYSNKYQDWRGGFNSDFDALGPGKILMMLSIEKWFQEQIREVDFLRGTHAYKADWQPLTRQFTDLRIFRIQKLETLIAYIWLNTLKPLIKRSAVN